MFRVAGLYKPILTGHQLRFSLELSLARFLFRNAMAIAMWIEVVSCWCIGIFEDEELKALRLQSFNLKHQVFQNKIPDSHIGSSHAFQPFTMLSSNACDYGRESHDGWIMDISS